MPSCTSPNLLAREIIHAGRAMVYPAPKLWLERDSQLVRLQVDIQKAPSKSDRDLHGWVSPCHPSKYGYVILFPGSVSHHCAPPRASSNPDAIRGESFGQDRDCALFEFRQEKDRRDCGRAPAKG